MVILRAKLTETEDRLALVGGAVLESVWKMHNTMLRLLAANDVNKGRVGYAPMRQQILENMNDMGRNVVDFFNGKQLVTFSNRDVWPPVGKSNARSD